MDPLETHKNPLKHSNAVLMGSNNFRLTEKKLVSYLCANIHTVKYSTVQMLAEINILIQFSNCLGSSRQFKFQTFRVRRLLCFYNSIE